MLDCRQCAKGKLATEIGGQGTTDGCPDGVVSRPGGERGDDGGAMPDQSVSGVDEDLVRGEFVHLAKRGPERRSQRPQDRA